MAMPAIMLIIEMMIVIVMIFVLIIGWSKFSTAFCVSMVLVQCPVSYRPLHYTPTKLRKIREIRNGLGPSTPIEQC